MKNLSPELVAIDRPVRWDHPLDAQMLTRDIGWMLNQRPFSTMNPDLFSSSCSIENVLRHDSRILRFEPGDIVVREGDYGSSAFLVLRGSVRAFLESLWSSRGKPTEKKSQSSFLGMLANRFRKVTGKESNSSAHVNPSQESGKGEKRNGNRRSPRNPQSKKEQQAPVQRVESNDQGSRIFLQDIQAVISDYQSEPLGVGEIFGEMAAITRTQHRYTVVAETATIVLEIRWQGLRMLRRDKSFRDYLDTRFRETSLKTHLRETSLFRFLDDETMNRVLAETKIESIGEREWFAEYRDTQKLDIQSQIEREPVIASEGQPVQDLMLLRAGFARLSFEHGRGHQTVAYLGRGQMHGLSELAHQYRNPTAKPIPFQESLRALGFVDVLRIPRELVMAHILPQVRSSELPKPIHGPRYDEGGLVVPDSFAYATASIASKGLSQPNPSMAPALETSLVEFLVDERLINGKQTMLIDLDRCTGCDECVKACANTHDGIPRFVRNGKQYGPLLFAHACMHCLDPVCMIGCPTGAIARDQETGVISINADTCIGCKTCAESCPYDNIVMIQVRDQRGRAMVDRKTQLPILQASKCDMCHSLKTGPSCQNACPHEALIRIDTSETASIEAWLGKRVA